MTNCNYTKHYELAHNSYLAIISRESQGQRPVLKCEHSIDQTQQNQLTDNTNNIK